MRIGHGYDVHRLVPGRKLILGGVEIPFERGLDGHSDADVLTHALMDALHALRAAGCDDNGRAADISPAHSAITVFLNSAPLTIKFLKRSKAALAGDSSTISPGFACCAAA